MIYTFGSLCLAALWEWMGQRRAPEFPVLRRRLGNLSIWLINILLMGLVLVLWPHLQITGVSTIPGVIAGFLVLDMLSYWVHRAQHAVPLLWRLHALHHSDPDVDWTTSVRHHPIEYLIATSAFWGVAVALGISAMAVGLHATAVFFLAAVTHANSRLPRWLERLLQPLLITLDLHLVHHSIATTDRDTNFGAVLSIWDRLFGTYRRPSDVELTYGVAELSRSDACRPLAMLATPWRLT